MVDDVETKVDIGVVIVGEEMVLVATRDRVVENETDDDSAILDGGIKPTRE